MPQNTMMSANYKVRNVGSGVDLSKQKVRVRSLGRKSFSKNK